MTDQVNRDGRERDRELLSALMDGEASEHELHQALRAADGDAALGRAWGRYHVARTAMQGQAGGFAHIDLRAAIAAGIDAGQGLDATDSLPASLVAPRPSRAATLRRFLKPLASVAVAASVAVLTVVAWQSARPVLPGGDAVVAAAPVAAKAQTVALGPMVMVREDGEELVMPGGASPTAGQDRLNAYLARHAQASSQGSARGLAPYARVVSLEGEEAR